MGTAGAVGVLGGNIFDHHRSGCGSITLPQFCSIGCVGGREIEFIVHFYTVPPPGLRANIVCSRVQGILTVWIDTSVVDIFDHYGPRSGSIGLPQFISIGSVSSSEINLVSNTDGCESGGPVHTPTLSAVDVLDHLRA